MARRITFTDAPDMAHLQGYDPAGTYGTWAVDDDVVDAPAGRHVVAQRDELGRLTVIVTAEDSIGLRHLRDLADAAVERARRAASIKDARKRGGIKSGQTRRANALDDRARAMLYLKKQVDLGIKQMAAAFTWLSDNDQEWNTEPNKQVTKAETLLRKFRKMRQEKAASK